jgi:hypothetical protein
VSKKTGKLSNIDIRFMIDNCHKMSIEDMAEELNRTPELVKNTLTEKGLWVEKTTEQVEEENRIVADLHKRSWWSSVVAVYNDFELELFKGHWIDIIRQFVSDITPSEAAILKNWCSGIVELYRLEKQYRESQDNIDALKDQIAGLEVLVGTEPEKMPELMNMKNQFALMVGASSAHITNREKLNKEIKTFMELLKADRTKRREVTNNADTYWGLVEKLNDEKYRADESYKAELGRIAKDKAKNDLQELTNFVDGTLDYPLLNSETMEKEDE